MKPERLFLLLCVGAALLSCTARPDRPLPRGKATPVMEQAFEAYLQDVADHNEDLHSVMVIQHGKVVAEKQIAPDTAHFMMSVSKTFTATAVGFAIEEGLLHLDDRIVDLFPDQVPENASDTLAHMTVRHLLTMNSGHAKDPTGSVWHRNDGDWIKAFLEWPLPYEPGSCYCYNSLGTYMLSAAVQKVSGEKIVDYLEPRLWKPLGIEKPFWQESPAGICCGGWGLYLKTEDMARMGLCLLQGGKFAGKQVIPATWVSEMSARQVDSAPSGLTSIQVEERGMDKTGSDWLQGYGYQMWRCRHGAFRADGARGQYIIILPEQDAVIVTTAQINNMAEELNLIWKHLLPAL